MNKFKITLKSFINNIFSFIGLRIISKNWGPKGFLYSFKKLKHLDFEPELIIDVGAARGEWSLECLEAFPDSNYLLIDPLPENKKKLETLKISNSFNFWSGALGSSIDSLELNLHSDQSSFYKGEYADDKKISVNLKSLDSLLNEIYPEIKKNILLKIDVQGFELEVLKGAVEKLKAIEVILIELSFREIYKQTPLADEVISFLHSKDFRIYDICTYAQRPSDNELAQSDILFVKKGNSVFKDESWNDLNN